MPEKEPANRTDAGAKRDSKGRFVKGCSGNAKGKRSRTAAEAKALDALYERAWPVLIKLINDADTPPRVKADIAKFAIEQKDGKATQRIAGAEDEPPVISIVMSPEFDALTDG